MSPRMSSTAVARSPRRPPDPLERRRSNIDHGEIAVAVCQQVVDQGRCATAHVDNPGIAVDPTSADKRQGSFETRSVPAHFVGTLISVHRLPVLYRCPRRYEPSVPTEFSETLKRWSRQHGEGPSHPGVRARCLPLVR